VLATLSTTRTHTLSAHGASSAVALTDGYHLAFTIAAALVIAAIAIGLVLLRPARTLEVAGEPSIAEASGLEAQELEPAFLEEAA
jgi:uncharacterized membrane protein